MRPVAPILSLSLFLAILHPARVDAAEAPAAAVAAASAQLEARDPGVGAAVAALRAAHPDDPSVGVLQVRWLLQQGEREDALDLAEDLADQAPQLAQVQLWLGNAYGQRIGEVGMLTQMRYAPKLRTAFERALALDPTLHGARVALVQYHLQAPAIIGGDPAVAKAQQRELARRDPPRGHWARALIAASEGDVDTATEAYLAAWKARPEEKTYRLAAGLALHEAQRWDEAHALFAAWVAEDPANGPAQYQLGRTAALSGRFAEDGIEALKRFLAMPSVEGQPQPQHAWWRLGQIHARAGDAPAARAAFEKALALDPELEEAAAELAKL